jgi:hypothetical protein
MQEYSWSSFGTPKQVQMGQVSEPYFRLFGFSAAFGRTFTPEEDRPNAGRFAILSDAFWKNDFSADRAIVGKTISLSGARYVVVGVLAPLETETPLSDRRMGPVPDRRGDNRAEPLSRSRAHQAGGDRRHDPAAVESRS